MNIDLSGRVALVSGGSRGIGRACALRLAESGADVVVNYVSSESAAMETAEQIARLGRKCHAVKADISEKDDVDAMLDYVKEEIGRLDIVISNAASGGFRPVLASTVNHFNATFHTNVLALIYLVQASLPLLKESAKQGRRAKIVAISSHGSTHALPMYGLVGGSKAALESIVRHMTLEVGDLGININAVKSGLVPTDSTRRLPGAEQMFQQQIHYTQVGDRTLQAEDIADAVLFLVSPMSDMIQGETVTVDGGAGFRAA